MVGAAVLAQDLLDPVCGLQHRDRLRLHGQTREEVGQDPPVGLLETLSAGDFGIVAEGHKV